MINYLGDWTYIAMIGALVFGAIYAVYLLFMHWLFNSTDPKWVFSDESEEDKKYRYKDGK